MLYSFTSEIFSLLPANISSTVRLFEETSSEDDFFFSETDEIGKLALQCSKLLTENIQQNLTEFRDNQRETRRPYEENVKKSIRNKKNSYDQMQREGVV